MPEDSIRRGRLEISNPPPPSFYCLPSSYSCTDDLQPLYLIESPFLSFIFADDCSHFSCVFSQNDPKFRTSEVRLYFIWFLVLKSTFVPSFFSLFSNWLIVLRLSVRCYWTGVILPSDWTGVILPSD